MDKGDITDVNNGDLTHFRDKVAQVRLYTVSICFRTIISVSIDPRIFFQGLIFSSKQVIKLNMYLL